MVVVGNFLVHIVNAETKEPFKEHNGPDGKIYAEVEPGVEYFVETKVVGGDPNKFFCYKLSVDGEELPYLSRLAAAWGAQYKGIFSIKDGVNIMKAFTFFEPRIIDSKDSIRPGVLYGDVKVNFFECVEDGTYTDCQENYEPGFKSSSANPHSSSLTMEQKKKVVRSGEGTVTISKQRPTTIAEYTTGDLLESINIRYCTAVGLIQAGVLKMPIDPWVKHRLYFSVKRTSANEAITNLQPKRVKRSDLINECDELNDSKEVDEFDLTILPDNNTLDEEVGGKMFQVEQPMPTST